MQVLWSVLCAMLVCVESESTIPDSLSRAFVQRTRFQTACFEFEYSAECPGTYRSPKHRYEARFAGKDIYWAELGDEDGIISRDPITGQPILGVRYACSPDRAVRWNDGKDE